MMKSISPDAAKNDPDDQRGAILWKTGDGKAQPVGTTPKVCMHSALHASKLLYLRHDSSACMCARALHSALPASKLLCFTLGRQSARANKHLPYFTESKPRFLFNFSIFFLSLRLLNESGFYLFFSIFRHTRVPRGYSAAYGGACRALSLQWLLYLVEYSCALQASLLSTNLYYIIKHWMQQKCQEIAAAEKKWRKKVRFINGSGFYLFFSSWIARFPRLIFESGLISKAV